MKSTVPIIDTVTDVQNAPTQVINIAMPVANVLVIHKDIVKNVILVTKVHTTKNTVQNVENALILIINIAITVILA